MPEKLVGKGFQAKPQLSVQMRTRVRLEKMGVPDWESFWDSNQWSPMFGTMAVAEIGCGLYFSMIMTGEHRGRIFSWGDAQLLSPCFYPRRSFGEWIEPIIDDLIAGRAVPFLNGRVR